MRVKWGMLMQPLAHALMANLAIARSEAPALLRAHLGAAAGWGDVNSAAAEGMVPLAVSMGSGYP